MKPVFIFIILLVNIQIAVAQSNTTNAADTSKIAFDKFIAELNVYRAKLNKDTVLPYKPEHPGCEHYVLVWQTSVDHNSLLKIKAMSVKDYCTQLKYFEKVKADVMDKSEKGKDIYGSWDYFSEHIGDKYIVITGSQAINSISKRVYYYVLKQ